MGKAVKAPQAQPTRLRPLAGLILGLLLGLGGLSQRFPGWLPPLLLVLAIWRIQIEVSHRRLPSRWLVLTLAVLGSAAVVASGGGPSDPGTTLALLALLTGVKLLETRTERDRAIAVFLGYFVVLANFLYSDTMTTAALMAAVVVILTQTLVDVADVRGTRSPWLNTRLAVRMLAQAAPVALVLFFLFPRMAAPLWGGPRGAGASTGGLSDAMAPGSISRLALSEAVAFRASFRGAPHPNGSLFWRGPVLEVTDGARWTVFPGDRAAPTNGVRLAGDGVEQTITLEPGSGRWLVALDVPSVSPPDTLLTDTYSLRAPKPLEERMRYAVSSVHTPKRWPPDLEARARALMLPARTSPRVRALADGFRREGGTDADVVTRALLHFREGPFLYTLEPPLLGKDPVDQFLFETRSGFCEHYAGAFTVLMRLAGVPTRVVTGYLGGTWNPLGAYWIIRQSDAHAWSEVWLTGRGWVRVDPTAWVAPERVDRRLESRAAGAARLLPAGGGRAVEWLRFVWDSVDNGWNVWVLGYGSERQFALLNRLGFEGVTWQRLTLVLALALGGLIVLTAVQVSRRQSAPADPARALYRLYCRKLARRGLPRLPHEGPREFGRRVGRARPELVPRIREVTDTYERLRYGLPPPDRPTYRKALRRLRAAVREVRP